MSSSVDPNPAPPQLHPWGCGGTFYPLELVHLYTQAMVWRLYVCMRALTWFSTLQMQPRPPWYTFLLFPPCLWWASFCHSFLRKEQLLRLHATWWMCKAGEQHRVETADLLQDHASCNHLSTTCLTQLCSISPVPSSAAPLVPHQSLTVSWNQYW